MQKEHQEQRYDRRLYKCRWTPYQPGNGETVCVEVHLYSHAAESSVSQDISESGSCQSYDNGHGHVVNDEFALAVS